MDEELYYYAEPNAMTGHKFTDDVAICKASSLEEAIATFKKLYSHASEKTVSKCIMNDFGVCILTDY